MYTREQVKNVQISPDGGRYWDFEIKPDELADFFRASLDVDDDATA